MSKKYDETLVDKRTVKKLISKGLLTDKDYDEYLKSLPDESKNYDTIKVYEEPNVLTFASVEDTK
jgi:hypothetical protein